MKKEQQDKINKLKEIAAKSNKRTSTDDLVKIITANSAKKVKKILKEIVQEPMTKPESWTTKEWNLHEYLKGALPLEEVPEAYREEFKYILNLAGGK